MVERSRCLSGLNRLLFSKQDMGSDNLQIYPASFLDTDADGLGNIDGIIAKLDYLKELGGKSFSDHAQNHILTLLSCQWTFYGFHRVKPDSDILERRHRSNVEQSVYESPQKDMGYDIVRQWLNSEVRRVLTNMVPVELLRHPSSLRYTGRCRPFDQ